MRPVCVALAVCLTGMAAACDSKPESPTTPAPAVPSVSGRWEGIYTVTGCVAGANCIPSPCRFLLGQRYRLQLALQQDAAQLKGHIDDELDQIFFILPGDVAGTIDSAGRAALTGTVLRAHKVTNLKEEYADVTWDTMLQSGAASMTGTYVKDWHSLYPTARATKLTHRFDSLVRLP